MLLTCVHVSCDTKLAWFASHFFWERGGGGRFDRHFLFALNNLTGARARQFHVETENCGKWEATLHSSVQFKGSNLCSSFYSRTRETESVEGRPFAMMAAQGSVVLWLLWFVSLILATLARPGSQLGMIIIVCTVCNTIA